MLQKFFSGSNVTELIVQIIAGTSLILIVWVFKLPSKLFRYIKSKDKAVNKTWKVNVKSNKIVPGLHINLTAFEKEFLDRESYKVLNKKFNSENKNLIITGRSGLGKTRSAYELIRKSNTIYDVLSPFLFRDENSFDFRTAFKKRKKVILLVDDLQKYDINDINFYIENLTANSSEVRLLCTCRSEHRDFIWSGLQISNLERFPHTGARMSGRPVSKGFLCLT